MVGELPPNAECKYNIKKTPLQLYHQEFLAIERHAGRTCNPVSREFWARVKDSYSKLSPGALEDLEKKSQLTHAPALSNRQEAKRRRLATATEPASASASQLVDRSSEMVALAPFQKSRCGCCGTSSSAGAVHAPLPPEAMSLSTSDDVSCSPVLGQLSHCPERRSKFPLSEDLFRAGLRKEGALPGQQHATLAATVVAAQFDEDAGRVGRDRGAVPKNVVYPVMCNSICRTCYGPEIHSMFKNMLLGLEEMVKRAGGFKTCVGMDLVLAFDVFGDAESDEREVHVALMTGLMAPHGGRRGQFHLALCDLGPGGGDEYQLQYASPVSMTKPIPAPLSAISDSGTGPLRVYSEDEWFAFLMWQRDVYATGAKPHGCDDPAPVLPHRVEASLLKVRFTSIDRFVVLDIDDGSLGFVVEPNGGADGAAQPGRPAPEGEGEGGDDEDVDWLAGSRGRSQRLLPHPKRNSFDCAFGLSAF